MNIKVSIYTSKDSWMNKYSSKLSETLKREGFDIHLPSNFSELESSDFCFLLSCFEILPPNVLRKSKHNLVVHASDLPKGRGWSPMSWQILSGESNITISLLEAGEKVDSGDIYLQKSINLSGGELVSDWRHLVGVTSIEMCVQFLKEYPELLTQKIVQNGEPTYYAKRKPKDSELDVTKSIQEQFNLLRIVDNERYPAYFYLNGKRYTVKIYSD